jgi:predicted LPLAT superfamily acyltransferase
LKQQWIERPEAGGVAALLLLRTFALLFGRTATRLLLIPITLYYLIRRGPERRASRTYLRRVGIVNAGWWEVAKHIHCFAAVILDRVYLLSERFKRFDVRTSGIDQVHAALALKKGVLIFGTHLGSFDALRVLSQFTSTAKTRVVIDTDQSPATFAVLSRLNPDLAASIINARQEGTATALAIKEALDEGCLVTLLVDRARPGNAVLNVDFLGFPAPLPTSPWLLAATLKVPVMLCFGLYRGGNRYDLQFEHFADSLQIERARREAALREIMQRFCGRLEHYARSAPYNWFNFYDFWQLQDSAHSPNRKRAQDAADGNAQRGIADDADDGAMRRT